MQTLGLDVTPTVGVVSRLVTEHHGLQCLAVVGVGGRDSDNEGQPGSPHTITHVGITISSTHMINAPYTGAVIRIDPIGRYLAATRPSQGTAA
jgi:hypothetical protein